MRASINGITAYKEQNYVKTQLSVVLVSACILGIVGIVLSTAFTGGAFLILGAVLGLVSEVMITAINAHLFMEAASELKCFGWKDQALMVSMTVLTIFATMVGCYFATTPIALATILASGACTLGMQIVSGAFAYHKSLDRMVHA